MRLPTVIAMIGMNSTCNGKYSFGSMVPFNTRQSLPLKAVNALFFKSVFSTGEPIRTFTEHKLYRLVHSVPAGESATTCCEMHH